MIVKLGKVCIKATGTVKRNRKNLPNNFGKEKLEQGNSIFYERGGLLSHENVKMKFVC